LRSTICDPFSIHAADWIIAITRSANLHSTFHLSIDRHLITREITYMKAQMAGGTLVLLKMLE
jgi:hypothetical protein